MRIANPSIRYFVRLLVGVLFIVSAFGKLMDVENFGNLIVSYGFFWSALLAPVIVIAEMGVGTKFMDNPVRPVAYGIFFVNFLKYRLRYKIIVVSLYRERYK